MFPIRRPGGTPIPLREMEEAYIGINGEQQESGRALWLDYLQKNTVPIVSATTYSPNNSLHDRPIGFLRPSNFAGKASQFAAQARKGLGSVISNAGHYATMLGIAGTGGLWYLSGKISSLFGFGKN